MLKGRILKYFLTTILALSLVGVLMMSVAADESLKGEVIVYHAGSLTVPVDNIIKAFNEIYPNVEVKTEAGGSVALARQIAELGKKVDVMMSADHTVIDNLLIPDHAAWNTVFAVNSLVIMYTDSSRYADEITPENWYEVLLRDGVQFGHSEPEQDPCGYRSVLLFQLAENHYQIEGLNQDIIAHIPQKNIRPKSVELIALLETGALDYAFEYESVALQHQAMDERFKFVKLPDAINLSSLAYADDYAKATIELAGAEPGTKIVTRGEPIVFSLTMPFSGVNRENAIAFLRFLLDTDKGLRILNEDGQPLIDVEAFSGRENIPTELADLIK